MTPQRRCDLADLTRLAATRDALLSTPINCKHLLRRKVWKRVVLHLSDLSTVAQVSISACSRMALLICPPHWRKQ
jgi:hypothetical protein